MLKTKNLNPQQSIFADQPNVINIFLLKISMLFYGDGVVPINGHQHIKGHYLRKFYDQPLTLVFENSIITITSKNYQKKLISLLKTVPRDAAAAQPLSRTRFFLFF